MINKVSLTISIHPASVYFSFFFQIRNTNLQLRRGDLNLKSIIHVADILMFSKVSKFRSLNSMKKRKNMPLFETSFDRKVLY